MSFRASYDTTTKVVSAAIFILFVSIAIGTQSIVSEAVLAVLFATAYAWSPTGYSISDGAVVVRRLIGNVRIPVDGIREVRVATKDDLRGSMRIFGSGGLFGYYGLFRTSDLGTSRWYVTNRSHSVVLVSDSETALISPDDVAGFLAALRTSAPKNATDWAAVGAARDGHVWAVVASLIVGAGTLAAIFFYAPGPPAYTLTRDSLAIHDRFFPVTLNAAGVDVGKVRVIDVDKDEGWRPVLRTGGIGAPHYRAGWFRVSSGTKVRMYRADSKRLVLLPPKGDGDPVLLETKDPDQFVAEVQHEWG